MGYALRMEITLQQYEKTKGLLPRQQGNVKLDNRQVLTAILYILEHSCKWRGLPERFGKWHTIYKLYTYESMDQERRAESGRRGMAASADHPHPNGPMPAKGTES